MKKTLFAFSTLITLNAHAIPTDFFIGQFKRMLPKTKLVAERDVDGIKMLIVQEFTSKRKHFGVSFLSETKELDEGSYHDITKQVVFDFTLKDPSLDLRGEIFQYLFVNGFNAFSVDVNEAGYLVVKFEISLHGDDQMILEKMKDVYSAMDSIYILTQHEMYLPKNLDLSRDVINKIKGKKKPLN